MDGGTVWNINLVTAIERCRELVDDDSKVTIDLMLTITPILVEYEFNANTIHNILRKRAIHAFYNYFNDVVEFKRAYPKVNFRYLVQPSEIMQFGLETIDFANSTHTWAIQLLGRIDGQMAVSLGEGFFFDVLDEWIELSQNSVDVPNVGEYMF